MNKIILIISFLFLFSSLSHSEEKKETKQKESVMSIEKMAKDTLKSKGKTNDTTKCSNSEKCKKQLRKNDKFIDSDSDGMNDERCKGMGFGGTKKRVGKCCEKK